MEWKSKKIGELCEVTSGQGAPQDKNDYSETGISFIRAGNLDALTSGATLDVCDKINKEMGDKRKLKLQKEGTVVFAKSGMSCLKSYIYKLPKESYVVNHLACLSPLKDISSDYLRYVLNYKRPRELINDMSYPSIRLGDISNMEIPVASIEVQKQIVEVLDEAQKLIDNRKKQIKLLDNLIESIFYDMFGDPVKNDKDWEVDRLGNSSQIITGNTPPRKDVENYGNHIEWIKSDNINTPYTYLTEAEEYLSVKGKEIGRYVDKGSILMTCIAGSIACIGNIAITDREVAFNQQINAIVPLKYNLYFMYALFITTKEYIQKNSTSSMKGMISKGNLSNLEFIIPPIQLQNQFAEKVELIEKQKSLLEQSLKLLEDNYNNLMQRVFKGELF